MDATAGNFGTATPNAEEGVKESLGVWVGLAQG